MKKQETKLDKLWSAAVLKRDPMCRICHKEATDPHHLFGRRARATRWLLLNGIGLCRKCHQEIAHGKPDMFWRILATQIPYETLETLERLANSVERYPDYDLIEKQLKEYT